MMQLEFVHDEVTLLMDLVVEVGVLADIKKAIMSDDVAGLIEALTQQENRVKLNTTKRILTAMIQRKTLQRVLDFMMTLEGG